ncbi:MAG: nuclear transport factor 2 family protein [Roseiarcus sp.]|uniref:nuclear transport factor 2 family protein n=1 Tax=Roseiarcus sp. TaxID=1969460 RepID=UPI003C45EC60
MRRDVIDATNGEQVPWDNSSLVDDLYLAGMESTSPSFAAVPPIAPAPAPAPQDPCATASLDDYATPIRNVFTALTQRDLALYADQWADDAIYHNSRTGEIRAKEQIVGAKRQAFARWSRVGVELRGPVLISRSERNAVLEDEYTLTVVSGGRSLPADSGRERYSVRCDASGRWTIVRNDDYLK